MQPVLARTFASGSPYGRALAGLDLTEVLETARTHLDERPRSRAELRELLSARWPGYDANSLAQAVTYLEPVVQVPPRGVWGEALQAVWARLETFLDRPLGAGAAVEEVVLRYLAAYGPATVRDVQAWCGLTRLREVVEPLRPRLRTFRDEHGRELVDLPDAPRPEPDTPAPVRYLPEYDNVLLGHADRGRFLPDRPFGPPSTMDGYYGHVLVDGILRAAWQARRDHGAATLAVEPFEALSTVDADAVEAEGARLLAFSAADADPDRRSVRVGAPRT